MSESPQSASVWGWRGAACGVTQRMKLILDNGERSDIQFVVGHQYGEEQLFRAHKFVLCLGSDVFDRMFHGDIPETTEKIELPDILPQAFGVMLRYLYTDVVEDLDLENVLPTLYCAKKYGLPKLLDVCAEYAIKKLDKKTLFTMLEAAAALGARNIVSKCLEIVDAHCSELVQSPGFLQLKSETLWMMFSRDTLIANEEDIIYKAAERWAINACRSNELNPTGANYRSVLGKALFAVRFPLLNDEQLANGPLASGLLLNEELLKIYQFKHATDKPDLPFSRTPRPADIVLWGRRWIPLEKFDTSFKVMTASNVFLDEHGHLHLRVSQQNGIWAGAGIQSADNLGFGRYEFQIEGLDRLDYHAVFAVCSQAENEPGVGIDCITLPACNRQNSCTFIRFSIRSPNCIAPFTMGTAHFDSNSAVPPRTTHSYHRKPDSVSFSSQHGHQCNNTTAELCKWSYDSRPNTTEKALPLFICLNYLGSMARDRKATEIIVHSVRYYPDE